MNNTISGLPRFKKSPSLRNKTRARDFTKTMPIHHLNAMNNSNSSKYKDISIIDQPFHVKTVFNKSVEGNITKKDQEKKSPVLEKRRLKTKKYQKKEGFVIPEYKGVRKAVSKILSPPRKKNLVSEKIFSHKMETNTRYGSTMFSSHNLIIPSIRAPNSAVSFKTTNQHFLTVGQEDLKKRKQDLSIICDRKRKIDNENKLKILNKEKKKDLMKKRSLQTRRKRIENYHQMAKKTKLWGN